MLIVPVSMTLLQYFETPKWVVVCIQWLCEEFPAYSLVLLRLAFWAWIRVNLRTVYLCYRTKKVRFALRATLCSHKDRTISSIMLRIPTSMEECGIKIVWRVVSEDTNNKDIFDTRSYLRRGESLAYNSNLSFEMNFIFIFKTKLVKSV